MPQLLWDLWRIGHDPALAEGLIERLDCSNHGHVDYFVQIEGKSVEGRRHNVIGATCQELRKGQRIAVYYERTMPKNNYAFAQTGDASRVTVEFWTGLIMWLTFVVIGPLFLVFVWTLFSKIAIRMNP